MKVKFFSAVVIVLFTVGFSQQVQAQTDGPNYKSAIGAKVWPFAINFKTFVGNNDRALEVLAYVNNGFRVTGLYEFHTDITTGSNLKLYAGLGAHGGYYSNTGEEDGITAGLDGVIGLDYKFNKIPLNLALDWQPSFEFITPKTGFQGNRGGLAVRFVL